MSMIAFRKRQKEFSEILTSSSNLNPSRFFRLMALAGTEVLFGVPLAIAVIVINATHGGVEPLDWNDVHQSTILCLHCPGFCT
jgi:pheromone a factor receptor